MFAHSIMVLGITSALAGGPPLHDERSAHDPAVSETAVLVTERAGESRTGWTGLIADLMLEVTRENAPATVRWSEWDDLSRYRVRTQPDAMTRFWVGGFIERLLLFFDPDIVIPVVVPFAHVGHFDVLDTAPVVGAHSSPFGFRTHPISKRRKLHAGLDFDVPRGTLVRAAGPGEVVYAGRRGTYGNLVVISHGLGLETRYAHLHRIRVQRDRLVAAGTVVGTVGSTGRTTGPHLHFEVRQFGEPIDPTWAMGLREPTVLDELSTMWSWLVPTELRRLR